MVGMIFSFMLVGDAVSTLSAGWVVWMAERTMRGRDEKKKKKTYCSSLEQVNDGQVVVQQLKLY